MANRKVVDMEPLTIDAIMQAIGSLGFPIAAFLLLFWQQQTTLKELTNAINSLKEFIKMTCPECDRDDSDA